MNPVKAQVIRKDGSVEDVPLVFNDVVLEGFQYLLGSGFRAVAQISNWYLGLITSEGVSDPVLDESDTLASKAWSETTTYSEATRPEWAADLVDEKNISNNTAREFTFNANSEIRGVFVASSNTKGGTSGTLWATALFAANMSFTSGEILKVIYSVSAS